MNAPRDIYDMFLCEIDFTSIDFAVVNFGAGKIRQLASIITANYNIKSYQRIIINKSSV